MIKKDEIEEKAQEYSIHTSNVQRDYVFGWVLAGIYTISELKNYLIFKGGNCLRKAYFENTRYSNDLDFSIQSDLSEEFIKRELNRVCDYAQELTGIIFEKERNRVEEKRRIDIDRKAYEARIYFKDFYGNESKMIISIKLDISHYDKIFLPIQTRYIIHPYSDYGECKAQLKCIKLEEILASKLKCLLQRRHSFDLYDYVFYLFFNPDLDIKRTEIISTLLKMTIFERSPGMIANLLIELPFQILKGIWTKYLVCPIQRLIDFDSAVVTFKNHITELFGKLPIVRGYAAFFPAHLRYPILQAGADITLLEIVYDGIKRIVEPYSLVYKVRKDGVGSEYFYVYDRTGGRYSGPGIKTFLHPKIESINNLDENFEPRYEIELSKAGEPSKKSYFGQPFSISKLGFKKSRISKRGISSTHTGPIYIYECIICGKTFRRKKSSTKLNKHKDEYGNRCYGKTGILRETIY